MAKLTAAPSPIVVDKSAGETNGTTDVHYEKERDQELWERFSGGAWAHINVHVRTGLGDEAQISGDFPVTLKPGMTYEIGVFERGHGPTNTDPIKAADLTVFCLWKKPSEVPLITDQNRDFGGTWYRRQTHTSVPTSIVEIGVSRKPPFKDVNGLTRLSDTEGGPTAPPALSVNDHIVELGPILPGQHYFFVITVADEFGNWDVQTDEFTTLRRQFQVEFPTLHIYNDGDPFSHGEGEFWFYLYTGDPSLGNSQTIQEFHLPTSDIDDWSETDRPYALGFSHIGGPEVVTEDTADVRVGSRGIEHDGFLESDEGAWSKDKSLGFPWGRLFETVTNKTFLMDCPTATDGDDFHYGVDVRWSVSYVP